MQSLCGGAYLVSILVSAANQGIRTAHTAKVLEVERMTFAIQQLPPEAHHDILWMAKVLRLVA